MKYINILSFWRFSSCATIAHAQAVLATAAMTKHQVTSVRPLRSLATVLKKVSEMNSGEVKVVVSRREMTWNMQE